MQIYSSQKRLSKIIKMLNRHQNRLGKNSGAYLLDSIVGRKVNSTYTYFFRKGAGQSLIRWDQGASCTKKGFVYLVNKTCHYLWMSWRCPQDRTVTFFCFVKRVNATIEYGSGCQSRCTPDKTFSELNGGMHFDEIVVR